MCMHCFIMKDVRFNWGLPQVDSFMKLKELVTSAPVLVLPDDNLPFQLEANSSGITTGASSHMMTMHGTLSHSCPRS
jgi:hypothetical protein